MDIWNGCSDRREQIFFKSPGHKERFLSAIDSIGKVYENGKIDQEYGAALYVLTAEIFLWKQAQSYVSRHGISIETLLKEIDLSGGYSVLIKWAGNLFNGHVHIDPVELMRLDASNYKVALAALEIRRTVYHTWSI